MGRSLFTNICASFMPSKAARRRFRLRQQEKDLEYQNHKLLTSMACLQGKTVAPAAVNPTIGFERVLQKLNLEVLQELDRICRKHNLRYWMDWGTLLGSVRHGGFIPWDDDVDIAMLSEDYEKFIELLPQELGDQFVFQRVPGLKGFITLKDFAPATKDEWTAFALKRRDADSFCFAVDIFPMHWLRDDVNEADFRRIMQKHLDEKRRWISCLPHDWSTYEGLDKKVKAAMAPFISETPTQKVFCSIEHCSPKPIIHHAEDIFPIQDIFFEGSLRMAPSVPEMYLWNLYGNWGKLVVSHFHISFDNMRREDVKKLVRHGKRLGCLGVYPPDGSSYCQS